jgi:hypothetical protein
MLIASLMREQRAAEDRAIFDAYRNGGLYKGKPVTDAVFLAHLKARRDGFSTDDPLYDQWNNQLIQTEFSIGEQKIDLAFKQGKVGAGAVAAFYRSQLSKIPKDSAFYREVAGRAADWAKSAAGAARAGRARGLAKALEGRQNAALKTQGDYLSLDALVTGAAREAGLIRENDLATDADATELMALFQRGAVIGANGQPVSFADWQAATVAAYRAFDTRIQINEQLNRGTIELKENKSRFFDERVLRQNVVDDRTKWEVANDLFFAALKDANDDPAAILAAAEKYAASVETIRAGALAGTGLDENDPDFLGALENELDSLRTGKAAGPGLSDLTGEGVRFADGTKTTLAAAIGEAKANADLLRRGLAFYGQDKPGGPLQVIPYKEFSDLDPFSRNRLDPSFQQAIVTIGGKPKSVMLKGQPIMATALQDQGGLPVEYIPDKDGKPVPVANATPEMIEAAIGSGAFSIVVGTSKPIGYVFDNPVTGARFWGVFDQLGNLTFTQSNPFGNAYNLPGVEGGPSVVVPGGFDPVTGKTIVPNILGAANVQSGKSLFVDDLVSPADLLALAENSPNADAYRALAAERSRGIANEQRVTNRQTAAQFDYRKFVHDSVEQIAGPFSETAFKVADAIGELLAPPKVGTSSGAPPLPSKDDLFTPPTPPAPTATPPPTGDFVYKAQTPDPNTPEEYADLAKEIDWDAIANAYKPKPAPAPKQKAF